MANLAQTAVTSNHESRKNVILSMKFYMTSNERGHHGGLINLSDSQYQHINDFADKFNLAKGFTRLGAKGSFQKSIKLTIRKLQHLAAVQHEEMRQGNPQRYLLEMSEYADLLQIRTSRPSLAASLGISERTLYNHIKFLQSAAVDGYTLVSRTATASNRRIVKRDDDGRIVGIVYETVQEKVRDAAGRIINGKGDWIIWLPKQAFCWNFDAANILSAATDNQLVTHNKRQNLPTSIPVKKNETIVSCSITKGENGASQPSVDTELRSDETKNETGVQKEGRNETYFALGAAAAGREAVSQIFEGLDRPAGAPVSEAENSLLRNLKATADAQEARSFDEKHIPGTNFRNTLIAILVILYRTRLFPRISDVYWDTIEPQIHNRMALWMGAVQSGYLNDDKTQEVTLVQAFSLVRRGIVKVNETMRKHPGRYQEGSLRTHPVNYLDFERQDSHFSFKSAMSFVKNEQEKLHQRIGMDNQLYRWQVPFARKEVLVTEAYKLLASRQPEKFIEHAKISYGTLRQLCEQMQVPANIRAKLFNSFLAEIGAIKQHLETKAGMDNTKAYTQFIMQFRELQFQQVA